MQLRSATRNRPVEDVTHVGNGVYIRTTPSATGQGRHTRWDYDQEIIATPIPVTQKVDLERQPIPRESSFNSLFDGSLSSISSSSDDSFSGMFDEPESAPVSAPEPTPAERNHDLLDWVTRNATQGGVPVTPKKAAAGPGPERLGHGTPVKRIAKGPYPLRTVSGSSGPMISPNRPLQRNVARNWHVQSDGSLVEVPVPSPVKRGTHPVPHAPRTETLGATLTVDIQGIFERELETLLKNRNNILAEVSAIENANQDGMDLDGDAHSMAGPSTPRAVQTTTKRLGPHGTELIDGSDEEPSREPSIEVDDYEARWVTPHRLRPHPTDSKDQLDIMMD